MEAIKERDPERAGEMMRQHIQKVKHILINFLREFPA
jgi:DNA-binding GntR family transcriptional regulator